MGMNATTVPCNYALLRFRPYTDSGEFVNVGLVLWCEPTGFFDFCCDTRTRERVRAFFPHLDHTVFEKSVQQMAAEISRAGKIIAASSAPRYPYQELIRQREGILTFGPGSTALTTDPKNLLDRLVLHDIENAIVTDDDAVGLPSLQMVLRKLKVHAPATIPALMSSMREAGFTVPDSRWLNRCLDRFRKQGLVTKSAEGVFCLTEKALAVVPHGKNRMSSDIERVLALGRRKW